MSRTKRKLEVIDSIEEPPKKKQRMQKYIDYSKFSATKYCNYCKEMHSSTDFNIRKRGEVLSLQPDCVVATRIKDREHRKKAVIFRKKLICEQGKCAICRKETMKMEFAHYVNSESNRNFCQMTITAMKKEMPKGRFLCCMCHCKETLRQRTENLSMKQPLKVEKNVKSDTIISTREK